MKFEKNMTFNSETDTTFNYINRNYQKTIVLLPGWASDYRIFDLLDVAFNYLLLNRFYPLTFEKSLFRTIKSLNLKKVSILGWSLGGFAAVQFALKYPDYLEELILIGIKMKYRSNVISGVEKYLKKNKKAYLNSFYNQCFSDKDSGKWFKDNLLKIYCEEFDLNNLIEGLYYLKEAEINPKELRGLKKIKIIHGEYDNVAAINEAGEIADQLPNCEFIAIKGGGHMPFFDEDLSKYVF